MKILTRVGLKNIRDLIVKVPVVSASRRFKFYSTQTDVKDYKSQHRTKTVDEDEIKNFSNLADRWWNEHGEFKALHSLNKLRVPFVRDGLRNTGKIDQSNVLTGRPLKGLKILDVGCGGGILSEPLARLGAEVVGLDASHESIASAIVHAKRMIAGPKYVCETIEEHATTHGGAYDAVVLSEVLEHIQSKDVCLQLCTDMLKPCGSVFITTINRTILSWMGVLLAAEYLLQFIPPNTHHWDKFISPKELQNKLGNCGCNTRLIHGMSYNILCNKWYWTSNTSVNFAIHAVIHEQSKNENLNVKL